MPEKHHPSYNLDFGHAILVLRYQYCKASLMRFQNFLSIGNHIIIHENVSILQCPEARNCPY
jgi:hypothetical protein